MTMAKPTTYKQARRIALVAYRQALKAAERGDWNRAVCLTDVEVCAFCEVGALGTRYCYPCPACEAHLSGEENTCPTCPATRLCRVRHANWNASLVRDGSRTHTAGLQHIRKTIAQLEALEL